MCTHFPRLSTPFTARRYMYAYIWHRDTKFIYNKRANKRRANTEYTLFFFCYTQNGRTNAGRREVQQQHEKKKHSSNLSPSYFLPHSVKRWCNPTATERVRSRPWQQHKAYSHNTQSLLRVLLSTAASKYLKISLHKK